MSTTRRAVVVGGGVVGVATADALAKDGWAVTVIDKGTIGAACSSGNCGLVCPSHVLPLAEPGAIGMALKSIFRKDSPFSIKPRLDPSLWGWLLQFALRCNSQDMMRAGRGIQALLESSMRLYRDLMATGRVACEWESRGLLFAYAETGPMESYAEVNRLMADSFHCPAERLDGDALQAREPALNPGLAGGWYYEDDAHLRPDKLMSSWRSTLEAEGVTFAERHTFEGFAATPNGRASAVVTDRGEFPADAFVVATGALTPMLHKHLGCRVPIQPGKGYSLTMPRPAVCLTLPVIFPETRVVATPFQSGYRLGSTMEFAGYDETINRDRLRLLKDGASPYLREPYCEPVEDEWFGWRPMTYDGLPIIDRSPLRNNVVIAAGHNMLGLSMAPATGKLVAEILGDGGAHIDPTPYQVSRF